MSSQNDSVSADVTSIVVSCGTVTPTKTAIASYFYDPRGVVMDASGDVFVADTGNSAVEEIPHSNGRYGDPIALGLGLRNPEAVALDSNGDVFVADSSNGAVKEIPYSNGSYGAPVTIATGFYNIFGIAVDSSGNVFVADQGPSTAQTPGGIVKEIPNSAGTFRSPGSAALRRGRGPIARQNFSARPRAV